MKPLALHAILATLTLGLAVGCGNTEDASQPAGGAANATPNSEYVLAAEPDGAQPVREVRESAGDGDEVVIVGRIGGSTQPFLDGYAGFTIVDPAIKHCGELHDDGCPTPWDYCCSPREELAGAQALVKLVNEQGQAVRGDAKSLLSLKELNTVVVRGKARRDEAGNLTVEATGIHVRS